MMMVTVAIVLYRRMMTTKWSQGQSTFSFYGRCGFLHAKIGKKRSKELIKSACRVFTRGVEKKKGLQIDELQPLDFNLAEGQGFEP
jgi:hypothetical protein